MKRLIVTLLFLVSLQLLGQAPLFELQTPFEPFNLTNFVARVVDFNNDGLEDVIGYQTTSPNSTKIWIADGNGSFNALDILSPYFDDTDFQEPQFNVDINKDGWVDLVLSSWAEGESGAIRTYSVFLNQEGNDVIEGGTFSTTDLFNAVSSGSTDTRPRHLVDLNSDGFPDWVVTDFTNKEVWILETSPDAPCDVNSATASLLYDFPSNSIGYSFVDIDDDHDLDFVAAEGSNQYYLYTNTVQLNDGNGQFSPVEMTGFNSGRASGFVATGDLNGDRKIDMYCGQADCCVSQGMFFYGSQETEYQFQSTPNAFSLLDDPYIGNGFTVDLDLDGNMDILWGSVTAISTQKIQCHQGFSNGTFNNVSQAWNLYYGLPNGTVPGFNAIGRGVGSMVLDWNHDSKPDVAINGRNFPAVGVANPTDADWQLVNTSSNHALRISLKACFGMTCGLGARVSAKYDDQWHDAWVDCQMLSAGGTSFLTFGSASSTVADTLLVDWVGGGQTILTNVAFDQTFVIQEALDCCISLGCMDEYACNYDAAAGCDDGSCDYSCCPGPGCCSEGMFWDWDSLACYVSKPADINMDGCVQLNDLLDLLSAYGDCAVAEWTCGDPLEYQGYDYATVQIGDQCWFAENVRYLPSVSSPDVGSEDDGQPHAYVTGYSGTDISEATGTANYLTYGSLYNFAAVVQWQLCPIGWSVPSEQDWVSSLEAPLWNGAELRSLTWNGTNQSGFNALPGGFRDAGGFFNESSGADYWTSTEFDSSFAERRFLLTTSDALEGSNDPRWKSHAFSVRCIKEDQ